jgi:predicted RNase H-like HicB family nuclease
MSEIQKKIDSVVQSIEKIQAKENKIFFFVQDTKGNPKGSVAFVYELAKILNSEGYNAQILHDDDYVPMTWLGEEYTKLPHLNIKHDFVVGAHDMIIVPEILGYIMEQLSNIPCVKVVLCQSYDYMFETLPPGANWTDFGFDRCITVTSSLSNLIQSFFPNVKVNLVSPYVHEIFTPSKKPSKPIIAIHTREQRDSMRIVKSFYTKYPQYRWFGFRDLRGLTRDEFAKSLSECCLSIWIDHPASFGTFPLEAMTSDIPVIGAIPNQAPEWMTEENGIWVGDDTEIIDHVAKFIAHWLEDSVPETFTAKLRETISAYTKEKTTAQLKDAIDLYVSGRLTALEEALTKLKEKLVEENEEIHSDITDTHN